ncbi:MAG: CHRD domain-containing protein [Chromatiales bacterium]|jgi:hypothetical protein
MRTILLTLLLALTIAAAHAGPKMLFKAQLDGFNAGGAPIPTNATGSARVEVIDEGTALQFSLNVAGIDNLLMAHIHVAPEPVEVSDPAGPVAYWFVGGPPPNQTVTERVNGVLSQGYIITDGDVEVWDATDPAAGTVQGLIEAIAEGRASVVVHTDDLNPDTPTGVAGDSRAGELRGTLR